jgi:hypothetical protein
MAGSSDSGSPPLMMVRSAGASRRAQAENQTEAATKKAKRAREKTAGRVGKWPLRYFDCAGASGALVGADRGTASKLFSGAAAGWSAEGVAG